MDELSALQTCVDALYALTPAERDRAMGWLSSRVCDDMLKEQDAAAVVGKFLQRLSAPTPKPARISTFR